MSEHKERPETLREITSRCTRVILSNMPPDRKARAIRAMLSELDDLGHTMTYENKQEYLAMIRRYDKRAQELTDAKERGISKGGCERSDVDKEATRDETEAARDDTEQADVVAATTAQATPDDTRLSEAMAEAAATVDVDSEGNIIYPEDDIPF